MSCACAGSSLTSRCWLAGNPFELTRQFLLPAGSRGGSWSGVGPNGKEGGAIRSLGGPGSQAFHKQEAERQGIEGGVRAREAGLRVGAVLSTGSSSPLVPQPLTRHIFPLSSGFFYSIFRGRAGVGVDMLSLPGGPEAGGFAPLLDFMYTSRLRLSPATAPAVLAAATYLQMEHVVQACHRFIQAR